MKKTINLYLDMEFTSLSPDAQPISIGIVSDSVMNTTKVKNIPDVKTGVLWDSPVSYIAEKSFYAEFDDFDLSRCDDWVKENVVGKLLYHGSISIDNSPIDTSNYSIYYSTNMIKHRLREWLDQFSDFNIQFVVDCGAYDWYWLVQLLAEWDISREFVGYIEDFSVKSPYVQLEAFDMLKRAAGRSITIIAQSGPPKVIRESDNPLSFFVKMEKSKIEIHTKVGLPKLPGNVSPVPQDLNDLIAFKKGISAREAFDLNREELALRLSSTPSEDTLRYWTDAAGIGNKHNALWDAKVIKSIFNKLTEQP